MENFRFNSVPLALIIVLLITAGVSTSPVSVESLDKVAVLEEAEANSSVPVHQLELVGTVEGKSYYFDSAPSLNWTQAKEYCNASGLSLATITTETQLNFLIDSYSTGILPDIWYYTAGREARRQWRMFSWDHTNDQLPQFFEEQGLIGASLPNDYFMCLLFAPGYGSLYAIECKYTYNVLCES